MDFIGFYTVQSVLNQNWHASGVPDAIEDIYVNGKKLFNTPKKEFPRISPKV